MPESFKINLGFDDLRSQDAFDFRSKGKATILLAEEQGFLTEVVARQEQPPLTRIPDSEGKHAAQLCYAIFAIFFIQMQDDLNISRRLKPMTFGD